MQMNKTIRKGLACLALCLLLAAAGCRETPMTIGPSEFSEETESALELAGDETVFFDYQVGEDIQSLELTVWTCFGGQWETAGSTRALVEQASGRIALSTNAAECTLHLADESGYTALECPLAVWDVSQEGSVRLAEPVEIQPGQEVALWLKAGDDGNGLALKLENFREEAYSSAVAVTAVFSQDPVGE